MSEVTHLIYAPGDNLKKFNHKIRQACSEVPVTHFEACLIKGGGVKVSLFTDYAEADEDDVKNDETNEISVGDTITDGPPCCAYLAVTNVENVEQKGLTEDRLDKLADLCQSSVTEEINLTGQDFAWVAAQDANGNLDPKAPPMYLPVTVSYTLIIFEIMARAEEDESEDDDQDDDIQTKVDDPNDPVGDDDDEPPKAGSGGAKKKSTKKKSTKQKTDKKNDGK